MQRLLEYAEHVDVTNLPDEDSTRENLRALTNGLAQHPPPESGCANALGARRYASSYGAMAHLQEGLGNYRGADDLLRKAVQCAPRDAELLGSYAENLMLLRRFPEARATLQRALDIDRDDFTLRSILLRLEFHEQNWPAVIELARGLQTDDENDTHWLYWQLMGYSAALRAGLPPPELPARKMGDGWPKPLWQSIAGRFHEPVLLAAFADAKGERDRRQKICEAMFYLGEQTLAKGDTATARRLFAQATRMKILDYVEHDLALGELARLRADAPSAAHLPAAAHDVLVAR